MIITWVPVKKEQNVLRIQGRLFNITQFPVCQSVHSLAELTRIFKYLCSCYIVLKIFLIPMEKLWKKKYKYFRWRNGHTTDAGGT